VWAFGASVIAVAAVSALPANDALSSEPSAVRSKRTVVQDPMVGQIMVKLRHAQPTELVTALGANRMAALSASAGVSMKAVRPMSLGASVVALPRPMKLSEANAIVERLKADPNVEWAAPDVQVRRMQTTPPNLSYASRQWNLGVPGSMFTSNILDQQGMTKSFTNAGGANLPPAWAATQGAGTVRVAIIDTGVTLNHPALQAAMLPGYDFISSNALQGLQSNLPANFVANDGDGRDADPTDPGDWVTVQDQTTYATVCDQDTNAGNNVEEPSSWHGTHMSGIVASQWTAGTQRGHRTQRQDHSGAWPREVRGRLVRHHRRHHVGLRRHRHGGAAHRGTGECDQSQPGWRGLLDSLSASYRCGHPAWRHHRRGNR
jgi:subtilisin family serine protease